MLTPDELFWLYVNNSKKMNARRFNELYFNYEEKEALLAEKKEQERQQRRIRRAIEQIEAELEQVDKDIATMDEQFATATEYKDDDYKRYDELKQRSSHLMHEWEKACYELELVSE